MNCALIGSRALRKEGCFNGKRLRHTRRRAQLLYTFPQAVQCVADLQQVGHCRVRQHIDVTFNYGKARKNWLPTLNAAWESAERSRYGNFVSRAATWAVRDD